MRMVPFVFSVALIAMTGCASQQTTTRGEAGTSIQKSVEKGIALLEEGQAKQANLEFNRSLTRTPSDANLHFLNGLAYRELTHANGQAVSELAETGFRLALEFDSNHWLAAWHLGLLQVEQRQYAEARKSLATAARLRPRNPDIQLALAGSAYQASDVPVALWAAENTLALRPDDPEALKIAALSSAALGMESEAHELSDRFGKVRPTESEIVADRIEAWKRTYAQADTGEQRAYPPANPSEAHVSPEAVNTGGAPAVQGPLAYAWSDCMQSVPSSSGSYSSGSSSSWSYSSGGSSSGSGDATERLPALPSPCKGIPLPRMAVVDVTLIRTQETTGYDNGINLLDGLKVVLGGGWSSSKIGDAAKSTTITRSLGLPQAGIEYSLKIFNAGDTTADVIARPSLLALDRTPSTFFSGSTVSVAMTGQYGGSLSDKNIGVSLSVTPTFIDDNRLLLSVKGARSFIEPAQFEGFQQAITSTNNIVSANVIMRFGETLILSGLRERENIRTKNGAPFLRDVPLLQYLFSNSTDTDYAHHVLILITPRKPSTMVETERAAQAYIRSPEYQIEKDDINFEAMSALHSRRPNLEAIMAKIQLSRYRKEFHSGDLSNRRFAPSPSLKRVLQDVKQMLYF